MKKIKIIVGITLVALAALSAWVDFSVWELQHPGAPAWTYLFAN